MDSVCKELVEKEGKGLLKRVLGRNPVGRGEEREGRERIGMSSKKNSEERRENRLALVGGRIGSFRRLTHLLRVWLIERGRGNEENEQGWLAWKSSNFWITVLLRGKCNEFEAKKESVANNPLPPL